MVTTKLEDGVFTVLLNRPEAMNALTTAFVNRIGEAVRRAAHDPAIRAVVVTGAGKAFCAGGDIKNLGKPDPRDPLAEQYGDDPIWNEPEMRVARLRQAVDVFYLLQTMAKPTIAMVNGAAVGAGMAPALACDFRIASNLAFFSSGYTNVALSGDAGMAYFLTSVVGTAKARELMFFPDRVEARDALRMGMVTRVVPHADLEAETMAFARRVAEGPTLAYGHMKENLAAALKYDPMVAFDIEARNFVRCFQTKDHKEAVSAFREKRKPVFQGR